jgi:hypothetical protein
VRELPNSNEIPLTIAALRLRESYHMARTLMLRGELHGRQIGGRWYVLVDDVIRREREHGAPQPA